MALTATKSPQGFQLLRHTSAGEVIYVPGDPGDTFTRGDVVVGTVGEGVVDPAAANEGGIVGRVAHTTVSPAATTAFPAPRDFHPANKDDAKTPGLIPINPALPAGTPIYLASFANHFDEAVAGYTAGTPSILATTLTGISTDDDLNGAIVYIYDGPGAGQVNVVADYDHAGHGDGNKALILHRPFDTAPTTSSSMIILAGEAADSSGIGFFNRCEGADEDGLTMNQGASDGDYIIYMDWRRAAEHLDNLTVPVVPIRYFMLA